MGLWTDSLKYNFSAKGCTPDFILNVLPSYSTGSDDNDIFEKQQDQLK